MDITLLSGLTAQQSAILVLLTVAVIKLVDQLADKDFRGAAKILGAALVGAVSAYGIDGLTLFSGIAYGLSASGLITTVGYVKKTTPVEEVPQLG